jgi:heme-degrading monooxygenase HmoA
MSSEGLAPGFEPPYWVVVFTSRRTEGDQGYGAMAEEMATRVQSQPGFLGMDSVRGADGTAITVAYFRTEADIRAWKQVPRHAEAQRLGREQWYRAYRVRVAKVEREYGWERG